MLVNSRLGRGPCVAVEPAQLPQGCNNRSDDGDENHYRYRNTQHGHSLHNATEPQ